MSFKMPSFSGDEDIDGCKGGINTICLILKSTANITIDTTANLTMKGNNVDVTAINTLSMTGRTIGISGKNITIAGSESISIGSPATSIS